MEKYLIEFTLGSRWGSGHGKKETYIVESNIDGVSLKRAHTLIEPRFGFEIGHLLSEYDSSAFEATHLSTLFREGLLPSCLLEEIEAEVKAYNIEAFDYSVEKIEELYAEMSYIHFDVIDKDLLLQVWFNILKAVVPDLELNLLAANAIFDLNYNIDAPGYGLFH